MHGLRLSPFLYRMDATLREPNNPVKSLPELWKATHDSGERCKMSFLAKKRWFLKDFISIRVYFLGFRHRA